MKHIAATAAAAVTKSTTTTTTTNITAIARVYVHFKVKTSCLSRQEKIP